MPRPKFDSGSPEPDFTPNHNTADPRIAGTPGPIPMGDLSRWAELVASGEIPFPADLSPEEAVWLAREVRRLRRQRLLQYIARTIALDIHRSSGPSHRGTFDDAETQL